MTQISRIFIFISFMSLFLMTCEYFYVQATRTLTPHTLEKKALFISFVGLPDLSLVTEARYVRHRSLSDIASFLEMALSYWSIFLRLLFIIILLFLKQLLLR